jgi:tRNA-(ms[2]io[6]A)-hydroxylase
MRLHLATSADWTRAVLSDFDAFLLDHASCERKASATAMKLLAHYADRRFLADAMVDLAREEMDHFCQVYRWIVVRGLTLGADSKDEYVNALSREVRRGADTYLVDRLLVAGIVEARGCERLGLVANALPEGPLKDFYRDLTRAEGRHHGLFVRVAREYFAAGEVESRLEELLEREAILLRSLPIRAAVH